MTLKLFLLVKIYFIIQCQAPHSWGFLFVGRWVDLDCNMMVILSGKQWGVLDNTEIQIWVIIGLLVTIGYYGFEWYIKKPDTIDEDSDEEE